MKFYKTIYESHWLKWKIFRLWIISLATLGMARLQCLQACAIIIQLHVASGWSMNRRQLLKLETNDHREWNSPLLNNIGRQKYWRLKWKQLVNWQPIRTCALSKDCSWKAMNTRLSVKQCGWFPGGRLSDVFDVLLGFKTSCLEMLWEAWLIKLA